MPKNRIPLANNHGMFFITPTVWNWYYLFDRHDRWNILYDSIAYCQQHKGLKVHAYVFMLNHMHAIISGDDVAGILRDFKRHTAKRLIENIRETEPSVLSLFETENGYRIWKEDNQPRLIESEKFARQKLEYILNNPVKKGYVEKPEHWRWSSANPNNPIQINPLILI